MAKQTISLGAAPSGVGGDTPRSANIKINANFDEIYGGIRYPGIGVTGATPPVNLQGLYLGWNQEGGGEGRGNFVCNKGGGLGGFSFRSVNADNSQTGPSTVSTYEGQWQFPLMPTANGAEIVARGTNANGEYIRYADGTQICRMQRSAQKTLNTSAGALFFQNKESAYPFPAAFTDTPNVQIHVVGFTYEVFWLSSAWASPTQSWPQGYVMTEVSRSQSDLVYFHYFAIGRWK